MEKIKTSPEGKIRVSDKLKYVIMLAGQAPMEAMKYAPSQIGDMADRSGYGDI